MVFFVTLTCAVFVTLLVLSEYTGRRALKLTAKPLASACFVTVGFIQAARGQHEEARWICIGLVLGAVSDVALMFPGKRAFLSGLTGFLLGHMAYVAAFAVLAPLHDWLSLHVLWIAAFGAGALRWLWPHLGTMRVPVVAYVVVICSMLVGAFAVLRTDLPQGALFAAGAVLFALSDLAVARERFVVDSFVNKAWGLPTYYAGQMLIAWALG